MDSTCEVLKVGYTNEPSYVNIPYEFTLNSTINPPDMDIKGMGLGVYGFVVAITNTFSQLNISNWCLQFKNYDEFGIIASNESTNLTDMLSAVYHAEIHMTLPIFTPLIERIVYVDMTDGLFPCYNIFIINPKPSENMVTIKLLDPFVPEVWFSWVLALGLLSCTLSLNKYAAHYCTFICNIFTTAFSFLFAKRSQKRFFNRMERTLVVVWAICAFFGLTVYKANYIRAHDPRKLKWAPAGPSDVYELIKEKGYRLLMDNTSAGVKIVRSIPQLVEIMDYYDVTYMASSLLNDAVVNTPGTITFYEEYSRVETDKRNMELKFVTFPQFPVARLASLVHRCLEDKSRIFCNAKFRNIVNEQYRLLSENGLVAQFERTLEEEVEPQPRPVPVSLQTINGLKTWFIAFYTFDILVSLLEKLFFISQLHLYM